MILNQTQNEAVMGNVEQLGEFRIRNSAKAFNILSSGLYANKIRAIIRELSCNAVDSHIAAGRSNVPFEIHLPTTLEPFFSIRDFGTGLTYDQVINIYTTYFESTKTDSNEFIGALGLGSKSPFSYTENFTIVTVKDGIQCIFTAYINESGVPSVALMSTDKECKDANGVEVRFAVDNANDFYKFRDEAHNVFLPFKLRPIVTGDTHFRFSEYDYAEKDIVPGVHLRNDRYSNRPIAIMGNIAYPIDLPNASALGAVADLLGFPLVMEFEIGELDFQASREGLSYIPSTIEAIKVKLEALNAQLAVHVAEKVKDIKGDWELVFALQDLYSNSMFRAGVIKYCTDTQFSLADVTNVNTYRYSLFKNIRVDVATIEKKYNVLLRAFTMGHNGNVAHEFKPANEYPNGYQQPAVLFYDVPVLKKVTFVVNDTNVGATNRAKYHYRKNRKQDATVFVIEAAEKGTEVKLKAFLKSLHNPPDVIKASTLAKQPVKGRTATGKVGVLRLERKNDRNNDMVFRPAGDVSEYSDKIVYYFPLSGYTALGLDGHNINVYDLYSRIARCGLTDLQSITIYGVRKADLDTVKKLKNWVNLETHLKTRLSAITQKDLVKLAYHQFDNSNSLCYYNEQIVKSVAADSLYAETVTVFKDAERVYNFNSSYLSGLCNQFDSKFDFEAEVETIKNKVRDASKKYPLLAVISRTAPVEAIAQYINLIDKE